MLAWVVLVVGLLGPACAKLERWNKESDELLDKVNDPGRSSSGSPSGSSSGGAGSGLTVVERKAMPVQDVRDARGRTVKLWGRANSTSTTPGHDDTIAATALEMASSGRYEYVLMQRSWRTATGRVAASRNIPDIIGVRHDGRVDAFEVRSKSDDEDDLMERCRKGMDTLPPGHRGECEVLRPKG